MKSHYNLFTLFLIFSTSVIGQKLNYTNDEINRATVTHKKIITIDTHIDININNFTTDKNYSQNIESQVNLPKMVKGGLDVAWFIVYTAQENLDQSGYDKAYKNAISKFDAIHRLIEIYAPNEIELALTSDDVKRIHASGKKVAMIGVENAYPLGLDIGNVKKFYDLGARYMSLAHNGHSQFSDSNTGEDDDIWLHHGLSNLGKAALEEMNKWGIMIDVSHPSKEAFMDMINYSKAPIIASHSSSRTMNDHSRNLDDEQLLLIKKNGGVVQIVAFKAYINSSKNFAYLKEQKDVINRLAEKYNFKFLNESQKSELNDSELMNYNNTIAKINNKAINKLKKAAIEFPPVGVADFIDHVDYLVDLIGIDHVGISSDFNGGGGIYGWNDASETLNITLELIHRGYSEEEIAKIWGLNLLRVMDEVENIAKTIRKLK